MRNGEQRDRETENEEVVEVETGNNDTTQDQTQTEQRGAARGIHTLSDNIGNLAGYFLQPTPPARRAVNDRRREDAYEYAREAGDVECNGYRGHAGSGIRDGK
jgi:hypothetical protein